MAFEYPDKVEVKKETPQRLVRRVVRFRVNSLANEAYIIGAAAKAAGAYGGYVKSYHLKSCIDTSKIVFKCYKDKWDITFYKFVSLADNSIERVRGRL